MLKLLIAGLFFHHCSAALYPFGDDNATLPTKWNSVAACPIRYSDLGWTTLPPPVEIRSTYQQEFAHVAAIGWTDEQGKIYWKCEGALITENFVLTTAHCGSWRGKKPDIVRIGDTNLNDDDDTNAQQLKIVEVVIHPQYTARYRYHDIALLRLIDAVKVHESACPACLWINPDVNFKSMEACGYVEVGDEKKLWRVGMSPVNQSTCSSLYPPKLRVGFTDDQICAVDSELKETCLGDTGGPLMVKLLGYARLHPFVIGLSSFRKGCDSAGVYVRVSSYVDWIEEITNTPLNPLQCTDQYYEFREFDPDTVTNDGDRVLVDPSKQHIDINPKKYEHRVKLEPGDCGGVFIHEQFVLTAASCIYRHNPKMVVADSQYKISNKIIHPNYRPELPDNDIALVKLDSPVVFKKGKVIPACLWTKPELPNVELEVTGTGPVFEDEPLYMASRAHEIHPTECKNVYETDGVQVSANNICYGNLSWYIVPESCNLDVGGPIGRKYWSAGKYHNFVMGINSMGNDCGYGYPAVATKVSNYIDWIDSIIFKKKTEKKYCQVVGEIGKCVPASECKTGMEETSCNPDDSTEPWVCCAKFDVIKANHTKCFESLFERNQRICIDFGDYDKDEDETEYDEDDDEYDEEEDEDTTDARGLVLENYKLSKSRKKNKLRM